MFDEQCSHGMTQPSNCLPPVNTEPVSARAIAGKVVLFGRDKVAVLLTPEAAEQSVINIIKAVADARDQGMTAPLH
jgi:hypothetical protein